MANETELKSPPPEFKTPPTPPAAAAPRELRYVGPKPAPRVIFPGDRQPYRADTLTPEQRASYIASTPEAKDWWK
jgi:hypothetical protein